MATPREPVDGAARRRLAEEPASVLAARQLAAEAVGAAEGRRRRRRAQAVPIPPLTDLCPVAS
jgi:hypothetical protein